MSSSLFLVKWSIKKGLSKIISVLHFNNAYLTVLVTKHFVKKYLLIGRNDKISTFSIFLFSDKNKSAKSAKSTENFKETFKYFSDDEPKITRNFSLIKSSKPKETSSTLKLKSIKKGDIKSKNSSRTNYGFNST